MGLTIRFSRFEVQGWLLCLYAISLSVENLQFLGLHYFSISKLFAAFYLLSVSLSYKSFFLNNTTGYYLKPLVAFYGLVFAVSIFNVNDVSQRVIALDVLLNIVLFVAMVNHSRIDFNVLFRGLLCFGVGTFLVSVLLYFDIGREVNQEGRVTFFGAGFNELGLKLVSGFMILTHFFLKGRRFFGAHWLLVAFLPLMLLSILETGSRTAYFALVLTVLVWIFFSVVNSEKKVGTFVVLTLAMVIVSIPLLHIAFESDVFIHRFDPNVNVSYANLGGRDVLWKGFMDIVSGSIFWGYGISGYEYQSLEYFGFIESPHNAILEILLYSGVIGLFLYSFFMFRVLKAAYYSARVLRDYMPMMLLCVFFGYFIAFQALSEKICWLILAYCVGRYLSSFYSNQHDIKQSIN